MGDIAREYAILTQDATLLFMRSSPECDIIKESAAESQNFVIVSIVA